MDLNERYYLDPECHGTARVSADDYTDDGIDFAAQAQARKYREHRQLCPGCRRFKMVCTCKAVA